MRRFPFACRPARSLRLLTGATALLAFAVVLSPGSSSAVANPVVPHYDHVFLIMEENNGYSDVIGNPAAPNLNDLAEHFGIATDYYGVSPDSSESNYVAMLGGSTFGITSDDAYWTQVIHGPSLISQLDGAGITWKAYLQSLPYPGYQGICYPARCNGAPDSDPLYVSKHDGIQNFSTSLNPYDWAHQVPIGELSHDLQTGDVPRFSYVVPDECHDMHGDPPYCLDSGNLGDPQNQHLVADGDAYLGHLVSSITNAPFWAKGNNAIAVTFDNGDTNAGCCHGVPGGGQVATVVITSHGPRGFQDPVPSNHYSMLSTIEHTFGLGCLQYACDTKSVVPLSPLLTVEGSAAMATKALAVPNYPTPTPNPAEPVSTTHDTPTSGGWTVQTAQRLGSSDNSLGAIAASSPHDVWAVGDYLPDAPNANPDATLSFVEHYDGTKWTVVRTPDAGPNFDSFYGVAASQGRAWAVGERLDSSYQDRALIETWNGKSWSVADNPQPGSLRDMLFGASAFSPYDVWVVGDQETANGKFETLVEHWDGIRWSVVPSPDPGVSGNHLYAVKAVNADDVWAVGQQLGVRAPDQPLVEHWDGRTWSVVPAPASTSASALLDAVATTGSSVWAVGEADSPYGGGRPLIEQYSSGRWKVVALPSSVGSRWTNLYGVTVSRGTVWVVGTYLDKTTDNNNALVLRGGPAGWSVNPGPDPGSGSNILGGITAVGDQLWAAGVFDNGGSALPFVEHR